jgi:hypothetical protein
LAIFHCRLRWAGVCGTRLHLCPLRNNAYCLLKPGHVEVAATDDATQSLFGCVHLVLSFHGHPSADWPCSQCAIGLLPLAKKESRVFARHRRLELPANPVWDSLGSVYYFDAVPGKRTRVIFSPRAKPRSTCVISGQYLAEVRLRAESVKSFDPIRFQAATVRLLRKTGTRSRFNVVC